MCKKFCWLCYSFISKVKQSFHTASGRSSCFEFLFWFSSAILIFKMIFGIFQPVNENLPNSSCNFRKHKSVFLQILHQSSMPSNITPQYFFLPQTLYILVKSSPLKCKFLRFLSAQVKIWQISHVNFEVTSQFLYKLCIIHYCHDS